MTQPFLHSLKRPWFWATAVVLLLCGGLMFTASGAVQACKDFDNVTICYDNETSLEPLLGEAVFRYDGNVTIARKGQAPLLKIVANPLGAHILHVVDGTLEGGPTVRFPLSIFGKLQFINDPSGQPIISTNKTDFANCGGQFATIDGKFKINPVEATITLPSTDEIVSTGDLNACPGVERIANAFQFDYLDRNGITQFFEADETSSVNLSGGIYKFDLTARNFTSAFDAKLKLNDAAENPNILVRIKTTIDEVGKLTGTLDSFKVKIAGLIIAVSQVALNPGTNGTPASFKAGKASVLKVDNPNQPSFSPVDANLIFEFTNLKYSQGKWEIDGVEVGMPDLSLGNAFNMYSNKIGFLNETINGQNVQSFQIRSIMSFGKNGTDVPIVLRIGRIQEGGVFKPVYQAGLQEKTIKLGTLTFKLKNLVFVGNEAEDFWGLKATTADLQWPAYLGGQTAAGIADFKLGVNKDRKLQFGLGGGTFGLPTYENQVFKGTLQATIGVVAESVTITGTGNFTLKLAGNNNSAGIAVNAILRYNREIDGNLPANLTANEIAAQMAASGVTAPHRICFGPGGSIAQCPGDPPPPPSPGGKAFELKLAGFSFKLAGFGLTVQNPRSTDDGGFAADNVGFSLPNGLSVDGNGSSGANIQGLVVKGNGDVSISGGGFELAPLKIGNFKMVGLKGTFKKETNGGYAFTGGAKFPLPGIEPGTNGGGIGVEVTIRVDGGGAFSGAGVKVELNSPPLPPIPIGTTGMQIIGFRGSFDLNNGTATISVGVTVGTIAQLPLGGLGSLNLATVKGDITVQLNPFKFIGNVELSVLIFKMASASLRFGDGEGFDGKSGMNVTVNVNKIIMKGEFKMRYSKGTPSDPNKRRFAASAKWTLGIVKNQFGAGRPPFNLGGIQAQLAGGIFKDTNNNPDTETIGIRASICGPNGNLCIGTFLNLGRDEGSNGFLDFTNIDKYQLIPAAMIRAAAERGEPGFARRRLTMDEVSALGLVVAADAEQVGVFEEVVDIPITKTTTLLAGIDYFDGAPLVRLKLPDGTILTEGTVNGTTQTVLKETQAVTKSIYFVISGAPVGTYQLLIDNATNYEKISYTVNESPKLNIGKAACSAPTRPPGLVNVVCINPVVAAEGGFLPEMSPSSPDLGAEINGSTATITWTGSDIDSPGATVDVGYVLDSGDVNVVDYSAVNLVAEDLPLASGSHTFDFKESGNGKYRFVVIADDGENGLVYLASTAVLSVTDQLAPAVPTGLAAVPQAGEMLVKWNQNTEKDLAGYQIGFGLSNDTNAFVYTRDMGPKEVVTGTNNIVDAKLWGLADDVTIFFGLRAYDTSGNYSAWTPLQSAKPWALSPDSWEPIPNGAGDKGVVEIAFGVPMKIETLDGKLVMKDASGQVVPGTTYFLTNLNGDAIGVGFQPASAFNGAASAVLTGGANGAQAADGRTMGGDYAWSFSLTTPVAPGTTVYLPIIGR